MEVGRTPSLRLIGSCAVAAALLLLAPIAQGTRAATPSLKVTFSPAGSINVTLPDGTPVGTTSGTPTVIPSGYYSLLFYGPGECINLPLFELRGPGVNINDDMLGGETDVHTLYATFLPNTTYTWHSDRNEAVVYTFKTSADVAATAAAAGGSGSPSSNTKVPTNVKASSQDIVGSAVVPFRGTLTGAVSAAGTLTVAFKGKSVGTLKAGRYTFAVTDKSSTNGFMLERPKHGALSVTGTTFLGKRTLAVTLTVGKWIVMPRPGKATYSIVVS